MTRSFHSLKLRLKLAWKAPRRSQKTGTTLLQKLKTLLVEISKMIGFRTSENSGMTETSVVCSTQLITEQQDELPKRSRRMLIPGTQVINRRQVSRSISHLQHRRWRKWIDENMKEHIRAMATEPINPISPITGRPQHMYEIYQARVPTDILVDKLEDLRADKENRLKSCIWEWVAKLRLKKHVGLREWEWCVGEPEDMSETTVDEEGQHLATKELHVLEAGVSIAAENEEQAMTEPCRPLTYAERMKTFKYTRGEDPMWKGQHLYLRRGNDRRIFRRPGDFSNEVSKEDQEFVPEIEVNVDSDNETQTFAHVNDSQEQADQMALTATEFIFGGVSRVEERQMEAEAQAQPHAINEVEAQDESHDLPESIQTVEIDGQGMQRFARHRSSSASGCSLMSDFSDED